MQITKKVLFLGKNNDPYTLKALNHLKLLFTDVEFYLGDWGDPLPAGVSCWEGEILISYKARWIIPKKVLDKAKDLAINFHPASPHYPGIGCINFALYENAKEYGSTCHHMNPKVDTGEIIKVIRFPIYPSDNVQTLLTRTYDHQLILFYEITNYLYRGKSLPKNNEEWTREPFTRKDFDKLNNIQINMDKSEIKKRIRATKYKNFRPKLSSKNSNFKPNEEDKA